MDALTERVQEWRYFEEAQLALVAATFANGLFRTKESDPTFTPNQFMTVRSPIPEPEPVEMSPNQTFEYFRAINAAAGGVEVIN